MKPKPNEGVAAGRSAPGIMASSLFLCLGSGLLVLHWTRLSIWGSSRLFSTQVLYFFFFCY
jgi:hypothetical protein